jgi:uncharacterized membrane protein
MPRFDSPGYRSAYRATATSIVVGSLLALAWLARTPELLHETLVAAGLSVAVFGKFIVLGGVDEASHLGPFGLALLVFAIDLNIAVVLSSGARFLERIPGLGRWLAHLRARAHRALEQNPGLSNMAFFGVVLYVFLPLAATGAVTGTLAARILGMSRLACLSAVALGSGAISLAFALVGSFAKTQANTLRGEMSVLALLLVAGLGWLVLLRVRRILRQAT